MTIEATAMPAMSEAALQLIRRIRIRHCGIRGRCLSKKHVSYKNYGAMGITLSPEFQSFFIFAEYVLHLRGIEDPSLSFDRIDPKRNYEAGNLRMASAKEQGHNRYCSNRDIEIVLKNEDIILKDNEITNPIVNEALDIIRYQIAQLRSGRAVKNVKWSNKGDTSSDKEENKNVDDEAILLLKRIRNKFYAIKDRCYNINSNQYKDYGGQGVCLSHDFHDFLTFALYLLKLRGIEDSALSLDRINVAGNYEAGNLRMATLRQQMNNKRDTEIDKLVVPGSVFNGYTVLSGTVTDHKEDGMLLECKCNVCGLVMWKHRMKLVKGLASECIVCLKNKYNKVTADKLGIEYKQLCFSDYKKSSYLYKQVKTHRDKISKLLLDNKPEPYKEPCMTEVEITNPIVIKAIEIVKNGMSNGGLSIFSKTGARAAHNTKRRRRARTAIIPTNWSE